MGGEPSHLAVLKAVALIDLFKDRSGLQATPEVLQSTVPSDVPVQALLDDLRRRGKEDSEEGQKEPTIHQRHQRTGGEDAAEGP